VTGVQPEAEADVHTCTICSKVVIPGEAIYGVTRNHYDCEWPNGQSSPKRDYEDATAKMDAALKRLGFKAKRHQAAIGEGGPTEKLREIIRASALEHYKAKEVAEIKIHLPPPVWRQHRFDVMRVEGSMRVDGDLVTFGSWYTVTQLIKFTRLKFDQDKPGVGMYPDPASRRTRSRTPRP
jgi:hypothetical protein